MTPYMYWKMKEKPSTFFVSDGEEEE